MANARVCRQRHEGEMNRPHTAQDENDIFFVHTLSGESRKEDG
jgi:hypothetical protein